MEDNNSNSKSDEKVEAIISDQKSKLDSDLKRLSKWYKALLICFIIFPFSFTFGFFAAVVAIGLTVVLIVTLILGIRSLNKIKRSKGTLTDNGYAIPAIITPTIIVLSVVLTMPSLGTAISRLFFIHNSWNLRILGEGLTNYAKNHDGQFPEADRWCDILKDSNDIDEWRFGSQDKKDPACYFALNKEAAKLGSEIPSNMVLLFDSERGWNQAGGIELVQKNRRGYVNILFGDNHTETIREKNVPYLRWKLDDSGNIPKPDIAKPFAVAGVIVAIFFIWVFAHFRNHAKKYWIFALVLGFVSMGVGMLLGVMAEGYFYAVGDNKNIGWIIGGVVGFLVGISYVPVLAKHFEGKKTEENITGYGTLFGMIAGAICSTMVHAFLMIFYEETSFGNMLAGLGFGVVAGTILGWVSSGIVVKFYTQGQANEVMPEEGSGFYE